LQRRKLARGLNVASARLAYFGREHGLIETPVVDRIDLLGRELAGPLIVEEYDATCVVPPGWRVSLDELCNLTILAKATK
jgi:N-methylhydantoinase A